MIHIGNQTACWAATPMTPFDYAVANGFDAFEWFPDKKPGAGWDESDLDAARRQAIRETARARGIRLSVHTRWQANPLQPDSAPLFRKDIELARDVGAALLNIHFYQEQGIAAFVEAIKPLIQQTAEAGLQLAIENTPCHSPEEFNELFARLRKLKSVSTAHVGMCLDLGHANLCAATRNDFLKFFDRLGPQLPLIHLHLHENWGDHDSHLPLFTGPSGRDDSGIRGLMARIQRWNFSGSIILEQWPQPPSLLNNARDRLMKLISETAARVELKSEPESEPEIPPSAPATARPGDFAPQLVAANERCRSWREKLDFVRELLAAETAPLTTGQLMDIAIYLRFLGTGQIHCVEDGRHFRPAHHARIALQIQERLAKLSGPDTAVIVRKIYPWLPSSSHTFQRAEPLTRIRDIAHRNDIPSDLKHEIKHTLQNKLHRCAGPEDLETSAAILQRITAPGTGYSSDFVAQFRIFHEELKEFFNARSLDERLTALLPDADENEAGLTRSFLRQKTDTALTGQFYALQTLTELRRNFLNAVEKNPGLETQEHLLADIGLEDFAFVLLSEMGNAFDAAKAGAAWEILLDTLRLTVANLALSGVEPEECRAIESELRAWRQPFDPSDREQLLRVKATADRARRLAEDFSDRITALFPPRVEKLGRALGVAEPAIRVFCDAEIRAHLVFQLSKQVSSLLRRVREQLALPAWDVVVSGRATGRVKVAGLLDELGRDFPEPILALLKNAEGDEEIPHGVAGVVLAHDLPHLSHLGVRARQAGVVFVACEEAASFEQLSRLQGQLVSLVATAEKVEWEVVAAQVAAQKQVDRKPVQIPEVRLTSERCCISLEDVRAETGGGKADGARRVAELARRAGAGFKTPPALVIPFGVMEAALRAASELEVEYKKQIDRINELMSAKFATATERLRELIQQLTVPVEIADGVAAQFDRQERLMVRSSANCEDLEELAGAGLYDSIANVAVADVAAAVRAVWASLWTRRAALSRRQAGIPHEQSHMAVLIQQMLTPDFSFVLHTVNPLNCNPREVYAEIAVGLGETLASGGERGSPYRLICDKISGATTTLALANFSHALLPDPAGGVRRAVVDYSQIRLSRDAGARKQLGKRLATVARFVEAAFQKPQDIEGAVVGDEIYLVQSRPQQGLQTPQ
jgi:phosphoglucan,water dikinase